MTYGQEAAKRLIESQPTAVYVALKGNEEALEVLLALAAASGYTDGMAAAAHTVGFPL